MKNALSRLAELRRKASGELRRLAKKRWVRRAPRLAALLALGGYVLYVAVANALLRFGAVEWFVNSSTSDAHLSLGACHTLVPGRIEVRDLRLRFQDANVEFEVVVPRGTATLDLFSLARKRLHLHALEADGVRYSFRHKVTSVAGNEKRLREFPRIEGFADPPILRPGPPPDKSKSWAFHLENVRARAVELRFMEVRFVGRAEVTGAFELVPGKKLWVGPAHLEFVTGELTSGPRRPLARAVRGRLDFRFRETNPDPVPGLEIFRWISAKAAFDADLVDLEAANLYTKEGSNASVTRGAGHLRARVELVDGRFVPESFLEYRGKERLYVSLGDLRTSAPLNVELRARARPDGAPMLVVDAELRDVALDPRDRAANGRASVTLERAEAMLSTNHADVASPWRVEEARFRLRDGRAPDLGSLLGGDGKKPVLDGGSTFFSAEATLARGARWSGSARVDVRRASVTIGDRRTVLDASFAAAAESSARDLETGELLDLALELTGDKAAKETDRLRASVRAARITWSDFPPKAARGTALLDAPHLEPILRALGAPSLLTSVWPDAPVHATARLAVEPKGLDVRLDLAKSGPFRAMGRLSTCSPPRGAFLVKSGVFSVGLVLRGGEIGFVPLASDAWLARNAPDCSLVE